MTPNTNIVSETIKKCNFKFWPTGLLKQSIACLLLQLNQWTLSHSYSRVSINPKGNAGYEAYYHIYIKKKKVVCLSTNGKRASSTDI